MPSAIKAKSCCFYRWVKFLRNEHKQIDATVRSVAIASICIATSA